MRGLAIGAAIGLTLLSAGRPACATPLPSSDLATVGACIRASSGGRPWLEKTLWGLYDQERGWTGAEILNRDGSRDLGPMQVNSRWVASVSPLLHRSTPEVYHWLRDDACFNVGVAAWLFLSGFRQVQDYWRAVGAYHSPTSRRARDYASRVAGRLRRRFGDGVFARVRTSAYPGSARNRAPSIGNPLGQ